MHHSSHKHTLRSSTKPQRRRIPSKRVSNPNTTSRRHSVKSTLFSSSQYHTRAHPLVSNHRVHPTSSFSQRIPYFKQTRKLFSTNNTSPDAQPITPQEMTDQPIGLLKPDSNVVSPNLDKLRALAQPDIAAQQEHFKKFESGATFDEMKNKQRGNYTVPSPFNENMVDSTQRLQQNFHLDQHLEAFGNDGFASRQHVQEPFVHLPGSPQHVKLDRNVSKNEQPTAAPTSNNVGTIGTLGEMAHDDEEQTFSRNLFYGFGANSFLVNSIALHGSVVVTPTMTYLWKPRSWGEVTPESLSFLSVLYPQPDVILFGCGATPKPIPPSVHHYLRTLNIPYELLSTHATMGTFNIMNEEYRKVMAVCVAYDHEDHYQHDLIKRSRMTH